VFELADFFRHGAGSGFAWNGSKSDIVNAFKSRGRTVLLTTHYMDEAERLCDRVAVVDHGLVIAEGPTGWGITPFEGNFYIVRVARPWYPWRHASTGHQLVLLASKSSAAVHLVPGRRIW